MKFRLDMRYPDIEGPVNIRKRRGTDSGGLSIINVDKAGLRATKLIVRKYDTRQGRDKLCRGSS